jgi:2-keto-3-deoxy-L-rhamnonate aldolase RhmA
VASSRAWEAHVRHNRALASIRAGDIALGMFSLEFASTGLARTVASAGADFVVFDQEHTGWTTETIRQLLASARATDIAPLVRVPTSDSHGIGIALALGALGVMVPMVDTEAETRAIVAAAKYPPEGVRGFAVLYEDEHENDVARYMREANAETAVIVMIETRRALENLDAIAAVPGVDVLWIGHYDLAASLGISGQFDHPDFREALRRVVEACQVNGIAAGMSTDSLAEAHELLAAGFRFVAYGHDLVLLRTALRAGISELRAARPVHQALRVET